MSIVREKIEAALRDNPLVFNGKVETGDAPATFVISGTCPTDCRPVSATLQVTRTTLNLVDFKATDSVRLINLLDTIDVHLKPIGKRVKFEAGAVKFLSDQIQYEIQKSTPKPLTLLESVKAALSGDIRWF